jgi:protein-disulfide isomerase
MSQHEIHEIEANMKDLQEMIDLESSLMKLRKNKDFKKVIEKEYLEQEAVRLVHLKADSNMQDEHMQARIVKQIDSIGNFTAFLDLIMQKADAARDALNECEELRAELEQESEE